MTAIKSYLGVCKPRVVALIVFTAVVGMFLSTPGLVPLQALLCGTVGIALASASAAAINHLLDMRADAQMQRTKQRPLVQGDLSPKQVLVFALTIGVLSMVILLVWVNLLTAVLTFASLLGYAVVYTVYLKRATPQNIVIGGAAGAAPPVLGWTAVTNSVDAGALLLFLIIFIWTPPHFWALAIARRAEYALVDIPMLPVTHGVKFTRLQIVLYTILLTVVTILPYLIQMSGMFYLVGVILLDIAFLYYALSLWFNHSERLAMQTFAYSILYLMALFAILLIDHYLPG